MAYNQIIITEKFQGTPLDVVVSKSVGVPIMLQPNYVVDVSDLFGVFFQNASIGSGFFWENNFLSVSEGF